MPDLEGQLGELTGHLRALVPTLEKVEERQNEAGQKAAAMEARHDSLRNEYNEFRTKVSNRIGEHYKSIGNLNGGMRERKTEIQTVRTEIDALKAKEAGIKQKIWDVVKILLTVVLTLIAARVWGK